MPDPQFPTQLFALWSEYTTWLATNNNPVYGVQPTPGSYGGAVSPSFEGFMKWTEFVKIPSQQ